MMRVYVIGGKFVALAMDEDFGDDITGKFDSDLMRMAEFAVFEEDEDITRLSWVLKKNRYDGERLTFLSLEDAIEYVQMTGGNHIQRHRGFIKLETDKQIYNHLAKFSPLWAEGIDGQFE